MTERALFLAALDMAPEQRSTFLDSACGRDLALRERLDKLLKAHEKASGFLDQPAHDLDATSENGRADGRNLVGPGTRIGPYEVVEPVGEGGMGVIYKAREPARNRLVAIKMILAGPHAVAQDLARFRTETEAVRELHHPHIVEVYEVGIYEGLPYLAMEFMDRGNLATALAGTPQPPRAAAELIEVLARAAHAAHEHGIVHRDLKPTNVMLTTPPPDAVPLPVFQSFGVPTIMDFGLAKRVGAEGGNTRTGAVMGTPSYMAPEQAEGKSRHVGPAADVYALGAILYEALTGRPPFRGATLMETLDQVRNRQPVAPDKVQPNLPRDLATICLRALAKEPEARYPSALALADDLRRFLGHEQVVARPVTRRERTWRWCRQNPLLAGLSGGVAALLLVLCVGLWVGHLLRQERNVARAAQEQAEQADTESRNLLAQLEQAKREATSRGHLSRASAIRLRRGVGQRFECLAELTKALTLEPSEALRAEIRTEAIAALALPDLEMAREWDGWPDDTIGLAFDDSLERFVRLDKQGGLAVGRLTAAGEEIVARIPAEGELPFVGPYLSRDGRFVLIWHGNIGFRVWDLNGPEPKRILDEKATYSTGGVAFRPDRPQLVVGQGFVGLLSVFDLETGKPIRFLQLNNIPRQALGFTTIIRILGFSPKAGDGQLAVACGDGVRFFDLDKEIKNKGHPRAPEMTWIDSYKALLPTPGISAIDSSGAWHPDGKRFATGGRDLRLHVWDVESSSEPMLPWEDHKINGLVVLAFNPAGDRAVSSDYDGQTRLWDAVTGRLLLTTPQSAGLQFNRDGSRLGYGRSGAKVRLYQVAAGRELRVIRRPKAAPEEMLFNPLLDADGRILAATSVGALSFFNFATGEELASARLAPSIYAAPWSFQRDRGWLTAGRDQVLRWPMRADPDRPDQLRVGPPRAVAKDRMACAAASADGRVVAVADGDAGAFVLHADRPGERLTLGPQYDVRRVAVSPDGRWVVTCSFWTDPIQRKQSARIWDGATGKPVHDLPLEGFTVAGFSPDNKWLATQTAGPGGKLWEVGTWRLVRDFGDAQFAFSPDSKLLALSDLFGTICLAEVATGREVARLTFPEPGWYHPASFSPDGAHLIATHSDQKALYVWDLRLVRQQLRTMGLAWDAPEYPPPSEEVGRPLRLVVAPSVPAEPAK